MIWGDIGSGYVAGISPTVSSGALIGRRKGFRSGESLVSTWGLVSFEILRWGLVSFEDCLERSSSFCSPLG